MLNKILIIDDSVDIQILLRTFLESNGYQIDCASDGAEALHLLNEATTLPDLILIDYQMPNMNGLEFLEQTVNNFRLKKIPTLLMSGEDITFDSKKMTNVINILKKPLSTSTLLEIILDILN